MRGTHAAKATISIQTQMSRLNSPCQSPGRSDRGRIACRTIVNMRSIRINCDTASLLHLVGSGHMVGEWREGKHAHEWR
jgi:hypothetical protein